MRVISAFAFFFETQGQIPLQEEKVQGTKGTSPRRYLHLPLTVLLTNEDQAFNSSWIIQFHLGFLNFLEFTN